MGRSTPHNEADVRCEPNASTPAAHTAAKARCGSVAGEPQSRATFGYNGSNCSLAIARYHVDRLMPIALAAVELINPWWR